MNLIDRVDLAHTKISGLQEEFVGFTSSAFARIEALEAVVGIGASPDPNGARPGNPNVARGQTSRVEGIAGLQAPTFAAPLGYPLDEAGAQIPELYARLRRLEDLLVPGPVRRPAPQVDAAPPAKRGPAGRPPRSRR